LTLVTSQKIFFVVNVLDLWKTIHKQPFLALAKCSVLVLTRISNRLFFVVNVLDLWKTIHKQPFLALAKCSVLVLTRISNRLFSVCSSIIEHVLSLEGIK